jgi:hypothetical protein
MVGWEARLGMLIPGSGGDRWCHVRPGDDLAATAREVVRALVTFGVPAGEHELHEAEKQPRECWDT